MTTDFYSVILLSYCMYKNFDEISLVSVYTIFQRTDILIHSITFLLSYNTILCKHKNSYYIPLHVLTLYIQQSAGCNRSSTRFSSWISLVIKRDKWFPTHWPNYILFSCDNMSTDSLRSAMNCFSFWKIKILVSPINNDYNILYLTPVQDIM